MSIGNIEDQAKRTSRLLEQMLAEQKKQTRALLILLAMAGSDFGKKYGGNAIDEIGKQVEESLKEENQ